MASASIESTVTLPVPKITVTDASRDDLAASDVVLVSSVNLGTAYTWSLAYAPEGSTATFSGSEFDQSPGTFTVDKEGPYLVRLLLTVPTVRVVAVPIPAGETLTINGVVLTAVSGGRTPGLNNFNGSLASSADVAADIVAALNDPANGFTGSVAPTVAASSAELNLCPVVSGGPVVATSSTMLMTYYATSYSEQFVRLRALTATGSLKLVSAGERVDSVPIPVDITFTGWADEQNFNLLTLLGFVSTTSASGNAVYVDPVDGDYQTIQSAMDYAQTQTPTATSPWVALVRPGSYSEDLTFYPHVHLFGWPGGQSTSLVRIEAATVAGHTMALPLVGDETVISNVYMDQTNTTSNAMLTVSGVGDAVFHKSVFAVSGAGAPQGPTVDLTGTVALRAFDCRFTGSATSDAASYAFRVSTGATGILRSCRLLLRGAQAAEGSALHLRDCEITSTAGYGINSLATLLTVEYSDVAGVLESIAVNPSSVGTAGSVSVAIRWSSIGSLLFDTTNIVGATSLTQGATEHGALTLPGGAPTTLAASTPSDTLLYDNTTTGLTAGNVQDALDEIYSSAVAIRTLDDAYDGGDPGPTGSGRTIVADMGAVQIVDSTAPSDPIPPANTNGGLEVVGRVNVGAIGKPEMELNPNPYGNGPQFIMGREIWANDAPYGSTSLILGNATGSPTYHNYNLTVGTQSADGGLAVGRVSLRGGDSLSGGVDAGSIFIQAGRGTDAGGGDGGDIFVAAGDSEGGAGGAFFLVRPEDATPATLTASAAFVGGVAGLVRFSSDLGAVEVTVGAGDTLPAVLAKFDATGLVTATDSGGGVIQLTSSSTGLNAEVFFLNADSGVDTALGGFAGQAVVSGTWPSRMEIEVSDANEITFGPNDPMPMIYNSTTGKLTVPGIIDPIGLVLDTTVPLLPDPGKGVIFVGDGTGGSILGDFYFRYEGGTLQNISNAVTGSTSIGVQDEGVGIGSFQTLNFTGSGVTATDAGSGVSNVTISSGGILGIEDEGVSVETDTTLIDFVGSGVAAVSTGPNSVQVTISGSSLLAGVAQEAFEAVAFAAGPPSSVTLANTLDANTAVSGLILLFRNGKADMLRVVGVPTTPSQYRVVGSTLEVGTDITGTTNSYLISYPHL